MLSAVLLLTLAAAPVEGEAERFKALFSEGEELFEQGDFQAAVENFQKADGVRRTPEVAFDLGKCHERLGDKATATYYYRLYLKRSPGASDALEVAERVGEMLHEAETDGRGLLEVESATPGTAELNGKAYPAFPVAVFLPPGDYELSATFPGGVRKRTVSMRTGKITSMQFELAPPPLVASEFAPRAELAQSAPSSRSGLRTPAYVSWGASAAALLVGSLLGASAAADEQAIGAGRSSLTVSEARALASSSSVKGGTANVLWAVGAAGAAAGTVMFVMSVPEPGVKR